MTNEESNNNYQISKESAESFQIDAIERTYGELFKKVSDLNDKDIIMRSNCKFCNHPIRVEAEERWERANRGSFVVVEKIFKTYEEKNPGVETMTYSNITNHLKTHYAQQDKQLRKREYMNRLTTMMNYKIDQEKQFELLTAALVDQFMKIGSDANICPVKQSDAMTKLSKNLIDIAVTQTKLRGELDVMSIVKEKLRIAWTHMISQAEDPMAKKELISGLDYFQNLLSSPMGDE